MTHDLWNAIGGLVVSVIAFVVFVAILIWIRDQLD
jgi:preprotein translocase subunit SecE